MVTEIIFQKRKIRIIELSTGPHTTAWRDTLSIRAVLWLLRSDPA